MDYIDLFNEIDVDADNIIVDNIVVNETIDLSAATIIGDLIPNTTSIYNIGENASRWKDLYLSGTEYCNTLQAIDSGTNLVLQGNSSIVTINDDLQITGNTSNEGTFESFQDATFDANVAVQGITSSDEITSYTTDSNLQLYGNGTGVVQVLDQMKAPSVKLTAFVDQLLFHPNDTGTYYVVRCTGNPSINRNLNLPDLADGTFLIDTGNQTLNGDLTVTGNLEVDGTLTFNGEVVGDLTVTGSLFVDTITAYTTNANLSLSGNGTGIVQTAGDFEAGGQIQGTALVANSLVANTGNNLILAAGGSSPTYFIGVSNDTTFAEDVAVAGDVNIVGNLAVNNISSKTSGINLVLSGNGAGIVECNDNFICDNISSRSTNTSLQLSGNGTGVVQITDSLSVDLINSYTTNANIELTPNGTGIIDCHEKIQLHNATATSKMCINGTTFSSYPMKIKAIASSGTGLLESLHNSSDTQKWHWELINTESDLDLVESGVATHRLCILHGGHVGINMQPSTSYALDVTGSIRTDTGIFLPTTGGSTVAFDYYEEYSNTVNFTSRAGATQAVTFYIRRIGTACSMTIAYFSLVSSTGNPKNTVESVTSAVPSRFLPAVNTLIGSCIFFDNATATVGNIVLTTGGQIIIYKDVTRNQLTATATMQIGYSVENTSGLNWIYNI